MSTADDKFWDEWVAKKEAVDWAEAGRRCDPAEVRRLYSHRGYAPHLKRMNHPAVGYIVLDTVAGLCAEVERLRAELDEAQLRSIEARNPGIDMDEVRRTRAGRIGAEDE